MFIRVDPDSAPVGASAKATHQWGDPVPGTPLPGSFPKKNRSCACGLTPALGRPIGGDSLACVEGERQRTFALSSGSILWVPSPEVPRGTR